MFDCTLMFICVPVDFMADYHITFMMSSLLYAATTVGYVKLTFCNNNPFTFVKVHSRDYVGRVGYKPAWSL